MPSTFPTSIDNFTDPLATSPLNSPSHSLQHANINDAVNKIETYMGLVFIATNTFSNVGAVELQNCFSSTYDNYRMVLNWYGSASTALTYQYMTGTNTRDTAATYNRLGFYWLAGINNFDGLSVGSDFLANHGSTASQPSSAEVVFYRPNVSSVRTNSQVIGYAGDSGLTAHTSNAKATTVAYTGLYVLPNAGTFTGTISIYGYRKA